MGHSLWIRFNAISMYALFFSITILLTSILLRSPLSSPSTHGEISIDALQVFTQHRSRDVAILSLDFNLHLQDAFDPWSTKLVFSWLQVEYSTLKHPRNVVVLWDSILLSRNEGNVSAIGIPSEYLLDDPGVNLKDVKLMLNAKFDAFPKVGRVGKHATIKSVKVVQEKMFQLPGEYLERKGVTNRGRWRH